MKDNNVRQKVPLHHLKMNQRRYCLERLTKHDKRCRMYCAPISVLTVYITNRSLTIFAVNFYY